MPAVGKINGKTTWTETRQSAFTGLLPAPGNLATLGEVKLGNATGEAALKPTKYVNLAQGVGSARPTSPTLSIEEVYLAPEVGSAELTSAMRLLPEAFKWTQDAVDAIEADSLIQADDAMLHVQALMPALFCCRKLGDGFAAVVNAIMSSFDNRGGVPMDKPQLEACRQALFVLRSEPRLSFERAFEYIMALERAGLEVSPAGTDKIAEWLSE